MESEEKDKDKQTQQTEENDKKSKAEGADVESHEPDDESFLDNMDEENLEQKPAAVKDAFPEGEVNDESENAEELASKKEKEKVKEEEGEKSNVEESAQPTTAETSNKDISEITGETEEKPLQSTEPVAEEQELVKSTGDAAGEILSESISEESPSETSEITGETDEKPLQTTEPVAEEQKLVKSTGDAAGEITSESQDVPSHAKPQDKVEEEEDDDDDEDSERDTDDDDDESGKVDYASMGRQELVQHFRELLKNAPIEETIKDVSAIWNAWNNKSEKSEQTVMSRINKKSDKPAEAKEGEETQAVTAEAGEDQEKPTVEIPQSEGTEQPTSEATAGEGDEAETAPAKAEPQGPDELELQFRELSNTFRERRKRYHEELAERENKNLEAKNEILEQLRKLIDEEEHIGHAFQKFDDIRQKWRTIGQVPIGEKKNLQNQYHHLIEMFFYNIKINKDLKDLHLQKNMVAKQEIIQKAEALLEEKSIKQLENDLKLLEHNWNEAGPVPREHKDELWEKYRNATRQLHRKVRDHYREIHKRQQENLQLKQQLVERAKELNEQEHPKLHKEWQEVSEKFYALQDEWKKIGYAPRDQREQVWQDFRQELENFHKNKQLFYDELKQRSKAIKEKKQDIIQRAEAAKENDDWQKTTQHFIELQKEWKEAGHLRKKDEDKMWKRFREACDHFFNARKSHFETRDQHLQENVLKRQEFIQEIKDYKTAGSPAEDLKNMKSFLSEWNKLPEVPAKDRNALFNGFSKALDAKYGEINLDKDKRENLHYKNKVDRLAQSDNSAYALGRERGSLQEQIRKLEDVLTRYETNISFFSKSKQASEFQRDIEKKIEETKTELEQLRSKLKLVPKNKPVERK